MSLALQDVVWRAGGKTILHGASLCFEGAQVTAIVGPNGAGKSTLLRLVSGLLLPSSGTVTLQGTELNHLSLERLAAMRAMLTQETVLRAHFTLRDLVVMGARVSAPRLTGWERTILADDLLARVGLEHFADRDVMGLSGGERQRAHLARVLMQLEAAMSDREMRRDFCCSTSRFPRRIRPVSIWSLILPARMPAREAGSCWSCMTSTGPWPVPTGSWSCIRAPFMRRDRHRTF
ncbi:ATP-binding cassette domain-containing protein [Gluconobacter aidae]|uniref:ATP-binding cassette domain-containing protein n=1 Tax=Gluconobacter aidae TaxID=2662454 RepID=UPI002D794B3C|nr:ATP-binding cassette domain-containing protein [Gluconobacter aidae]